MDSDVVSRLITYINETGLKIGDQLPSTLVLADTLGVSPSQIRTAMISLSSIGLIEIRPRSGSFVKALDVGIIERMFNVFLNQGITDESPALLNVYEFKTMVDSEVFPAAAQMRTNNDLFQLKAIIARQEGLLSDQDGFIASDEEFHRVAAKITRNPLYTMIMDVLQAMLRPDRLSNNSSSMETRKKIVEDHEKIFEAIKSQDTDRAAVLSRKHSDRRRLELIASI